LRGPWEYYGTLSQLSPELSGKQLEILKEVVPKLSRVAVIGLQPVQSHMQVLREIKLVAAAFGVTWLGVMRT
jgi:hypothetical protein